MNLLKLSGKSLKLALILVAIAVPAIFITGGGVLAAALFALAGLALLASTAFAAIAVPVIAIVAIASWFFLKSRQPSQQPFTPSPVEEWGEDIFSEDVAPKPQPQYEEWSWEKWLEMHPPISTQKTEPEVEEADDEPELEPELEEAEEADDEPEVEEADDELNLNVLSFIDPEIEEADDEPEPEQELEEADDEPEVEEADDELNLNVLSFIDPEIEEADDEPEVEEAPTLLPPPVRPEPDRLTSVVLARPEKPSEEDPDLAALHALPSYKLQWSLRAAGWTASQIRKRFPSRDALVKKTYEVYQSADDAVGCLMFSVWEIQAETQKDFKDKARAMGIS